MWMRSVTPPLPRALLPLALLVALPSLPARAQNATGSLRGAVQDSSGLRVPAANVAVQPAESPVARQTAANAAGEFRIDNLLPGSYGVLVSAKGFAEARSEVLIEISSVREIMVTLQPAPLQQSVSVPGAASSITTQPIDTSSAVHQGVVTVQDLKNIPLAARSFANIAYLVPGTEPVEPSDPTKARITAVSFGGSSGLNVELSVDGGDNSDDYIGGFLQNFSPDAIQEFAVRTSQEDADTGRTTAGSVVITTRRGTGQFHGEAAVFVRDSDLNARFPIDNPPPTPKQPFSRQNYVGTLGGPVKPGKLWFFSSFEYVNERASIAYSPSTVTQFNALAQLAAMGLIPGVNSIPVPSSVPVPFGDALATTRFDWAQSSRSQWFLRAASDRYTTRNDLVQENTLPSTGATSRSSYLNLLISNQFTFSSSWLGSLTLDAGSLHRTETRNSNLGFALAFPFSSTSQTISGLETFGDNQFVTAITAFPVVRDQQKYQFRYDLSHTAGHHSERFGINLIHEPVLDGRLTNNPENLVTFPNNPVFYLANPAQFPIDFAAGSALTGCPMPPVGFCFAGDGHFAQSVQRLGLYAQDSWQITPRLTLNYGVRWDTTFGLFQASGRTQLHNPALLTLQSLGIPLVSRAPRDYRAQFAPRLGLVYAPGDSRTTVFRAGFGLFFNDLAQNGWVAAFQAVNQPLTLPCAAPGDPGCIPPGASGSLIDPRYRTPYAIHATAGLQHAFNSKWMASADYTHEQGNHGYRRYDFTPGVNLFAADHADQPLVPAISVFRSDNRSSYNGLSLHLQGNVSRRFQLIANYTLSKAQTWGCVLGELFDYVNGVCDPLHAFAPGDYGPSGEDVRHRFVLAGTYYAPFGFELTTLSQAESARPFTLTTAGNSDRITVKGAKTTLDEFRGTPYIQADLRVSRPIRFRERFTATPFIEFFNLFNRSNPGANYVTNIAALPIPVNDQNNITGICSNPPACSAFTPVTSLKQLRFPAGALGDFFGPGTTVGIPFAAQLGARLTF
jgi:TonB dependent receptor/Carboxypeptidase regulatory-like domain